MQVNPAFGSILGYGPDQLIGASIEDLTHPDDRPESSLWSRRVFSGEATTLQQDVRYLRADGKAVWVSLSASCVRDAAGSAKYGIYQIEDITERRRMNEMVAHAAIHDPLTDLPNRTLLMDRLKSALDRIDRSAGHVMVAFVDLDHFKLINDSLGHEWGDRVLRMVADRINQALRPSDTVARFGGDEFVVVCESIPDEEAALELANRIATSLSLPLTVEHLETFITASVGIALARYRDTSPERLLSDADSAMYRAKERGRASIEMYNEHKDIWSIGRLRVGNDLHRAISRHEFELHYQPFVDLHSSTLVAVEALVRWRHPTRGLLAPGGVHRTGRRHRHDRPHRELGATGGLPAVGRVVPAAGGIGSRSLEVDGVDQRVTPATGGEAVSRPWWPRSSTRPGSTRTTSGWRSPKGP